MSNQLLQVLVKHTSGITRSITNIVLQYLRLECFLAWFTERSEDMIASTSSTSSTDSGPRTCAVLVIDLFRLFMTDKEATATDFVMF